MEKSYTGIVVKYGDLYFDMVPTFEIHPDVLKICPMNKMPYLLKGIAERLLPLVNVSFDEEDESINVAYFANPFFESVETNKFRKGDSYHTNYKLLSQKDFVNECSKIYKENPEENFSYVGVALFRKP